MIRIPSLIHVIMVSRTSTLQYNSLWAVLLLAVVRAPWSHCDPFIVHPNKDAGSENLLSDSTKVSLIKDHEVSQA